MVTQRNTQEMQQRTQSQQEMLQAVYMLYVTTRLSRRHSFGKSAAIDISVVNYEASATRRLA